MKSFESTSLEEEEKDRAREKAVTAVRKYFEGKLKELEKSKYKAREGEDFTRLQKDLREVRQILSFMQSDDYSLAYDFLGKELIAEEELVRGLETEFEADTSKIAKPQSFIELHQRRLENIKILQESLIISE